MKNLISNDIFRKIFCITVALIFIAVGVWCFYNVEKYDELSTELSVLGSLASVLGIIIALIQIMHTKSISEVTKEAAIRSEEALNDGLQKVQRVFTLTDISQIMHLPNEIQDSIQVKDWGRAYEKMRNLKDELVEFKNSPELAHFPDESKNISIKIQDLEVRIKAFGKGVANKKEPYAYNKAMDLMEETRTLLRSLITKMKYKNQK